MFTGYRPRKLIKTDISSLRFVSAADYLGSAPSLLCGLQSGLWVSGGPQSPCSFLSFQLPLVGQGAVFLLGLMVTPTSERFLQSLFS